MEPGSVVRRGSAYDAGAAARRGSTQGVAGAEEEAGAARGLRAVEYAGHGAGAGRAVWLASWPEPAPRPRSSSTLPPLPHPFATSRHTAMAASGLLGPVQCVQRWARAAFLPEGYPDTVTRDYLPFQVWDTVQGLCSYVRGVLTTQALLAGVGVGTDAATPLGAAFQWIMRDFVGMLGGILFTVYQGTNLDSCAKQWRLFADCMNNVGLVLELVAGHFPSAFLALACAGSVARALCGVSAGATRAALTHHFARAGNAADIAAKEGSQETASTLLGMLLGLALGPVAHARPQVLWAVFVGMTWLHVYANMKAVRALCLNSLNRERLTIALQAFVDTGEVPGPREVNPHESLLPGERALWQRLVPRGPALFPRIWLGARVSQVAGPEGLAGPGEDPVRPPAYLVVLGPRQRGAGRGGGGGWEAAVVLRRGASPEEVMRGLCHALRAARLLAQAQGPGSGGGPADARAAALSTARHWMRAHHAQFVSGLGGSGWDTARLLLSPDQWRAEWGEDSAPNRNA